LIRSSVARLALAASVLLAPIAAPALGLAPDPLALDIVFGDPGFTGSAHFVSTVTGLPAGGTLLAGSVGAGNVTFVFEITLDAGSPESAVVVVLGHPSPGLWTGIGTIPGAGADFVSGGIGGYANFGPSAALPPGATTDLLFVSAPSVPLGASVLVAMLGTNSSEAGGYATVVPEAGTSALLALGLAALGWRRARRC
jgi:hypothetical protein